MQDTKTQPPAEQAGDDEAALWRAFEDEDKGAAPQPPPEGREEAQEPEFAPDAPEAEADPPQADTDAPAPQAGETEKPADLWASAPPELRAAFEQEKRARTELEHQLRSDRGRLSAMQRKLDDLARTSPAQAVRPQQGESAQDRDERLKRLAEEYPEVAQPILAEMDALRQTVGTLQALEQSREQQAAAWQESQLSQQHADWREVLGQHGATFTNWLDDQPKAVREAAMRNAEKIVDAAAAADVVSRFKEFLGVAPPQQQPAADAAPPKPPLNDRRQRQLAASATPRGGGRPVATGIPEDGDPEAIWAAMEAQEQMETQRRAR